MIELKGNGVSPGIAIGKIYVYSITHVEPGKSLCAPGEEKSHLEKFENVKKLAFDELENIRLAMEKDDPEKAGIFRAHQDIVNDVAIQEEIPSKIMDEHWSGDWAIYKVY
ncbi:MAG: hypothetical protein FWB83_06535, partial [Treponema sp.]|nr:hypothetical protein [Treponema sp.]